LIEETSSEERGSTAETSLVERCNGEKFGFFVWKKSFFIARTAPTTSLPALLQNPPLEGSSDRPRLPMACGLLLCGLGTPNCYCAIKPSGKACPQPRVGGSSTDNVYCSFFVGRFGVARGTRWRALLLHWDGNRHSRSLNHAEIRLI
jgi:hypothetical protein